ncbi:MAG: NADPH:quinone oxidoreductase family protein [Verrucomicrobia bacterium]|nr:NADPH:quinone oxidoreductase family protein [Verrucomicrobiota bacterium]
MKAVQLSRFGNPDVLQLIEMPTPRPEPGEVLVRIHAAGVNFFEILLRQNQYAITPELPMILGVEVAGVVEELGEGVNKDWVGTRVAVPMFAFGRGHGGYAEYVTVNASSLVPLPEGLSFEPAVALLVQGLSARYMVRQSSPSDKAVVVTAAAGGVGSLLVQLAKRAGAKQVIALASTMVKLEFCRSLGADFVFDYTTPDWTDEVKKITDGAGADLIYDSVGGNKTKAAVAALAPGGQLLFAAVNRFKLEQSDLEKMILNNQSIKGFALLPLLQPAKLRDDLAELFALVRTGKLNITIAERFTLARANEAHRALENRSTIGKVVLTPA